MNQKTTDNQILQFHQQIVELIKKYQFRDRNQICCFGISVSQCYILETLHTHGPLTMNELAKKMYLKISTITRVVEQLVKKNYVKREEGLNDRRVRLINLTDSRRALIAGKCSAWASNNLKSSALFEFINFLISL